MKKKAIVIAVCVVIAVGAAFFGWQYLSGSTDDGTGVFVQPVVDLNMASAPSVSRFAGVVESQESMDIDPQGGKKVAELLVKEGDTVVEGQDLFRYDTDAIRLDIQQTELDIEMSQQTIAGIREDIEALSHTALGDTPESQMAAAQIREMEVNIAKEEYAQKQKKNELTRLQESLKDDTVKAPIAGTVRSVNEDVANGNEESFDMNGGEQHYIVLTASGGFRIKGSVSEQYIMDLYEGQSMVVHSRVNDDTWTGTIARIDTSQPEQNNNGYYYDDGNGASKYAFYVELDSTEGLMMGQHITLEPSYAGSEAMQEGLWLSSGWFTIAEDGTATVWMQGSGNRLMQQAVTLGKYSEEYDCYQVESGLTEDDLIAWPGEECVSGAKTTTTYPTEPDLPADDGMFAEGTMDEGMTEDTAAGDGIMTDDMAVMPMPAPAVG